MTSMAHEASSPDIKMRDVRESVVRAFCTVFGVRAAPETSEWLDLALGGIPAARPTP
jgi:hypothetical protein